MKNLRQQSQYIYIAIAVYHMFMLGNGLHLEYNDES